MVYFTDLTPKEIKKINRFSFSKLPSFELAKHYAPKRYVFSFEIKFANFKWIVTGTNNTLKLSDWEFEYESYSLDENCIGYEMVESWIDYGGSLTGLDSTLTELKSVFG